MIEKDDWRLMDQMDYLFEKELKHTHWKCVQAGWDHDHCEFCSDKIDTTTGRAYSTTDDYHWICETCFEDFKEMFQWTVVAEE